MQKLNSIIKAKIYKKTDRLYKDIELLVSYYFTLRLDMTKEEADIQAYKILNSSIREEIKSIMNNYTE